MFSGVRPARLLTWKLQQWKLQQWKLTPARTDGSGETSTRTDGGLAHCGYDPEDGGVEGDAGASAVDVNAIDDAVAIGSGSDHTCVLHRTGRISCWGGNARGQLGDGTLEDSLRAVNVRGLTHAEDVVALDNTSCALESDGQVACWGEGAEYATGFGDGQSAYSIPGRVCGIEGAHAIATSGLGGCALFNEGRVACWGWFEGTFGGDSINDAISVGTTSATTCVARQSDEVTCWGLGLLGFIGGFPAATETLTAPAPIQALGANGQCGVQDNGQVTCWATQAGYTGEVWTVAELDGVTALSDVGTCAIHHGGRVACFDLPPMGGNLPQRTK